MFTSGIHCPMSDEEGRKEGRKGLTLPWEYTHPFTKAGAGAVPLDDAWAIFNSSWERFGKEIHTNR
jgi:hypothetical protein